MKIQKESARFIIEEWQKAIQRSDALMLPAVNALRLPPESPPWVAVQALQATLTTVCAALVDDKYEWLVWYWQENDMGARGHEAGPTGNTRPIKTIDDLLWLIGGQNDKT